MIRTTTRERKRARRDMCRHASRMARAGCTEKAATWRRRARQWLTQPSRPLARRFCYGFCNEWALTSLKKFTGSVRPRSTRAGKDATLRNPRGGRGLPFNFEIDPGVGRAARSILNSGADRSTHHSAGAAPCADSRKRRSTLSRFTLLTYLSPHHAADRLRTQGVGLRHPG